LLDPYFCASFLAEATLAPVDIPTNIPVLAETSIAVSSASSSVTVIISSTLSPLYIPGINPAPIPCILCGEAVPPDNTGDL
jgi:hypothetical protein